MNIIAGIFTVYFALNLIQEKVDVSRWARFFLYLGVILPAGDYILRFVFGEIWYQTESLIFHSIFYHTLFWGIAALLTWVYSRDVARAGRLLLPLIGLLVYFLLSLFSLENLSFFAPFSNTGFSLGWVTPGYLVLSVFWVILWLAILGSELSDTLISTFALSVLVIFMTYSGISYHRVNNNLVNYYAAADIVSIAPANHQQTMWRVVALQQDRYSHTLFHFIQGQQGNIEEQPALNELETAQLALLDPVIRRIYLKAFKNPVIQVEVQNESLLISIDELVSLIEPLWVKRVQMRKNKSGQIVQFDVDYGTIL